MWLAAIATNLLLAADSLTKQRPDWDILPCSNKTWYAWKRTFRSHQLTLELTQRSTGDRGEVFGSSAAAIAIEGITSTMATAGASHARLRG